MTTSPSFMPITISSGIRASAARTPSKVALSEDKRSLTYAQLVENIDRVETLASVGLQLKPGEHVALMAPNCIEFIEIVCGLADAGLATAMVNPRLTAKEAAYICNDSQAQILFVHASLEEVARAASLETVREIIVIGKDYAQRLAASPPQKSHLRIAETDIFALPYTAGTTGQPKGVLLPHRSRVLTFFSMAVEYGCYSIDDRSLAIAPLYHGAGFAFAMAPMVPTHFNALFGLGEATLKKYQCPALKTIISNAAPLPQTTKQRIVNYFGAGILHETYGSTEGGIVCNLRPADQLRKIQCVGMPFPCTEVRLLDTSGKEVPQGEVGELYSRSPFLFSGYWGKPEASKEAFKGEWMTVGDMARKDEEGFIYLVDRKKDLIISGGVNIYPREIEEVLHAHPAVAEAAVIGVPDDYWGEAVKAYVACRKGATVTKEELIAFCQTSLAGFKLPKTIEFIDMLPRNAAGKVLKTELRQPPK
ncbi:MAG: AMP-binding protein [Proteobacteria bacterium]|nr:AMP-binding protein [Pseudomonadota bacterium]